MLPFLVYLVMVKDEHLACLVFAEDKQLVRLVLAKDKQLMRLVPAEDKQLVRLPRYVAPGHAVHLCWTRSLIVGRRCFSPVKFQGMKATSKSSFLAKEVEALLISVGAQGCWRMQT